MNFLEKLREKPDKAKKQIAFVSALLFAGLIFVVWLSVIFPSWKEVQNKEDAVSRLEPGPIESLGGIISDGINSIGGEISKAKDTISSFASSTATTTVTE